MNNSPQTQPPPSIGLDDVLYIFFRHKWKIIFFSLIGIGIAARIYLTEKTEYRSQAKLMVRYITDKKDPVNPRANEMIKPLDPRDAATLAAEAEIARSSDTIEVAVKAVGAPKILQSYGGGTNITDAVNLVSGNLQVDTGKSTGVLLFTLSHRDQEVAQRTLTEIISEYRRRHLAIHHSLETYDQVQAQTEEVRRRLAKTNDELRSQKRNANISNLEQSKAENAALTIELQRVILNTDAELSELRAQLADRKSSTNNASATSTNDFAGVQPSRGELARYSQLAKRLYSLREQEIDLLQTWSESSTRVQQARRQIADLEEQISKLNIDPVYLERMAATNPNGTSKPGFDWDEARTKLVALENKYQNLTNRLAGVRESTAKLEAVESGITELELRKKNEEEAYAYYLRNLDEIRLDTTVDATRRNNINVIQEATRIAPDSKKLMKQLGGVAAGGIGLGILLALLSDFVFNPSVKRTKDLENSLRIPVLATVPDFGKKLKNKKGKKQKNQAVQRNGDVPYTNGDIPPWEDGDPMLPYYEALRDRVVMSYSGDVHKPKIVGLTSCNAGAGVSRLATGLAASLSRDAERNVLLVGLQRNKVAVSAFAKGLPTNGIDAPEAPSTTDKELVAHNLYSLATTGHNLAGASVVQSFSELLPKLKICDYDYIIFDLPPLTQTSGSLRLASQMERTLLVVEAEETAKDKIKRARNLLKSSQANLFAVLNKTRSYGPKSLQPDL